MKAETVYIEDMEIGMSRSHTKTISKADIEAFGEVSGDRNPVHFDEAYAATTPFKTCIAHGILTGALLSTVLGMKLPGAGAIYMSQSFKFRAPVRAGETVTATATVREIDPIKRRVTLDCTCHVGDLLVLDGEAKALAPSRG